MNDTWVQQLQGLNDRLRGSLARLGDKPYRREIISRFAGDIRPMQRLSGPALENVLAGRPLVGVDGSINTFGGQFPYYIDLVRALAKPSAGEAIVLKDLHCPIPPEDPSDEETAQRTDSEVRQRKLANLEVQAALAAIDRYRPSILLMDGPLVRFDMRTRDSFSILRQKAIKENILLVGCIENIESKVLVTVMGDHTPEPWQNRYDRDLLWGALEYGEVLQVRSPAKGTVSLDPDESPRPIRTWFMRASHDPGVVGLDMLEEQVGQVAPLVDYLFTLSPPDGRGIPIWLDLVDREVRLTHVELEAYLQLLDPQVKRVFDSKRDARIY